MSRTLALEALAMLLIGLAALVTAPAAVADIGGPPVPSATTLIVLVIAGLATVGVLGISILILRRVAFRVGRRSEREEPSRPADEPDGGRSGAAPPASADAHEDGP